MLHGFGAQRRPRSRNWRGKSPFEVAAQAASVEGRQMVRVRGLTIVEEQRDKIAVVGGASDLRIWLPRSVIKLEADGVIAMPGRIARCKGLLPLQGT
jgi:hypothetical protein